MSSENITTFLTYYIQGLKERTREEKSGAKFGFDWIVYNLALAASFTPVRLPFIRKGPNELSKTKTEPEFGVDLSFLTQDEQKLFIFVLKDEELSNTTWIQNGFESDLRKAAAPNLDHPDLKNVKTVQIILAYNQDENQTGIQLFENLTKSLGTKIYTNIELTFDRWNLTKIVKKVQEQLLNPSLLPQKFFGQFNYICSQISDFRHGSEQWENQLIPNWKYFLNDLLKFNTDLTILHLIPISVVILRKQGEENPTIETGWIDLIEWALLEMWKISITHSNENVKRFIYSTWVDLYLNELDRYYTEHYSELITEDSLQPAYRTMFYLDAIASSEITYWHLGRIGLVSYGLYELILSQESQEEELLLIEKLKKYSALIIQILNANPSTYRPLLDIQHNELFLIWQLFWQTKRKSDIYTWLSNLSERLKIRRSPTSVIPFVDGNNSMTYVYEYVATGLKPFEFCDKSSVLLMVLLELCFCLDKPQRKELINNFYQITFSFSENVPPIQLMQWIPPFDWEEKILMNSISKEGLCISINFGDSANLDPDELESKIIEYVRSCRSKFKFTMPKKTPISALVLACIKYRTPIPPELWRYQIFGQIENMTEQESVPNNAQDTSQ